MRRRYFAALGLWLAVSTVHAAASLGQVTIDNFSSAATTAYNDGTGPAGIGCVVGSGSCTRTDAIPPLAGVLGGSRTMTVASQSNLGMIAAGAVPGPGSTPGVFTYDSTVTADGFAELLYDSNGAGLGYDFSGATGIEVQVVASDCAAIGSGTPCPPPTAGTPGYPITITLVDTLSHSASVSKNVLVTTAVNLDYQFASFSGVDRTKIKSIKVRIDPLRAADLQVKAIQTYGSATPTPTDIGTPEVLNTFTPTRTQTPTATSTATITPTATNTPTKSATVTSTPMNSVTTTRTATNTPTVTPTRTNTATVTPSVTGTTTITPTVTWTPTNTATTTPTATDTPTQTATVTPTSTFTPTTTPTITPTVTRTLTNTPTQTATVTPTQTFTRTPTNTSTVTPTNTATITVTVTRSPTNTTTLKIGRAHV